ncbi:helix-turn-helix domain-containing protein [Fictibacillus aquaticus]|uniref:helix-turn-helix domain-containing protein n=1 Tax=Fictibacillus aquaticus TaxID=2021314 RepID=UPI0013FD635A|nr:helix-turn-helix transcriptional regulator [Fictibacillus aquaticus]
MIRGEKIKYYREKNNLTQKELTDGICSIPYLSKVENNLLQPSDEILELLCNRLNLKYEELTPSLSTEAIVNSLKEWYEEIKFRNKDNSDHIYQQMQENMIGIQDIEILALFHVMSSRHFMLTNEFERAQSHLETASTYLHYISGETKSYYYYFLGLYEYLNGSYDKALEYYLKVQGAVNEPEYYYQLALIYTKLNKISMAITSTEKALVEFNKNILFYKVIDCYILLAVNYNRIHECETAKSYLQLALRGSKSLKDADYFKKVIYHNLGFVAQTEKKSDEAVDYFLQSIHESPEMQGRELTIYLLAKELLNMGKWEECGTWIHKGMSLLTEKNSTYYLLRELQYQVETEDDTEGYKAFIETEALPHFLDKKDVSNICNCYEWLGKYYDARHHYKKSSECYVKANQLKNTYY